LSQFKDWWLSMIGNAVEKKRPYITITPEYGPYPYALYRTNTQIPLRDQWEINNFIKENITASVKNISPSISL